MEVAMSVMVLPSLVLVPQYCFYCFFLFLEPPWLGNKHFYCIRFFFATTVKEIAIVFSVKTYTLKQFMPCNHMEQLFINKITWSSCKKDFGFYKFWP